MLRNQLAAAMFALVLSTSTALAVLPTEPVTPPVPTTPDSPRLGVKGFVSQRGGFQIVDVLMNYPAQDAGLEAGDLILSMDGTIVQRPEDVNLLLDRVVTQKGGQLQMIVLNHRDNRYYSIEANLVTIQYQATVQTYDGKPAPATKQLRAKNIKVTPIKK